MSESTPNTEGHNQEDIAVPWFSVPGEVRSKAISMDWDETIAQDTTDNLVGRVGECVVKRSKEHFSTKEDAELNEKYIQKQISFYQQLVPENTVPTQIETIELEGRWHVFQYQPVIPGVTTRQLEDEHVPITDTIEENYQRLYRRLYTIYRAEHDTNRYIDENVQFQLTKVQPIGTHAFENRFYPGRILASDNLMVHPETGQFYIFDFGRYRAWKPEMDKSYSKILEKAQTKLEKYMS